MKRLKTDCENFHRRDFLHVGALSLMSLGLPALLARQALAGQATGLSSSLGVATPKAKNVIMIWLSGGPSTIDMWDLKPQAPASVRGEFSPIDTSADGIQISEHLPKIAEQMKHCTLVRSLTHTVAEHGQGTEYVITGNPITPSLRYPSIGSIVANQMPGERGVPTYMDLFMDRDSGSEYGKSGYLSSSHNPFVVDTNGPTVRQPMNDQPKKANQFELPDGFTVEDLNRRNALLKKLEQGFRRFDETSRVAEMTEFQQKAVDLLSSGKTRDALKIENEVEALQSYGFGSLGRSALTARRLIQAGVRFVTIGFSGWDTHANNFGLLRDTLLPRLDSAVSALLADLEKHGLLDETIVYCVGEFNRTPVINGQGGRDHWARSMSVLLAGGGFKGGYVYGSTDKHGLEPDRNACSPTDLNATILNQLGIAPDTTLQTNSGRPVQAFRGGNLITDIVS